MDSEAIGNLILEYCEKHNIDLESTFSYIVDKRTHVVYMQFYRGYRGGITVVLKADGTPMLVEDLGIKVD